MCQAFEAEKRSMIAGDLYEIKEIWRKHESGERVLTDDEIYELAAKKMTLLY